MKPEEGIDKVYHYCINELGNFEIWPGYYMWRYGEFKKNFTLFPEDHFNKSLEIGCGIGYQAAFLSFISDKVVASDIDLGGMKKHSLGLNITRDFIHHTGLKNIEIVTASAENLPFKDEEFDFIYSSYAFQYVPDKDKALQEIKRVLKKGGTFFCILPTTAGRLGAAIIYYRAAFNKLISQATGASKKDKKIIVKHGENNKVEPKFIHKLLPPPDNDSNSFINELARYCPARWERLFKKNGFHIIMKKNTAFSPENSAGNGFFGRIAEKIRSDGLILIAKK